jgi:hypothetical protein
VFCVFHILKIQFSNICFHVILLIDSCISQVISFNDGFLRKCLHFLFLPCMNALGTDHLILIGLDIQIITMYAEVQLLMVNSVVFCLCLSLGPICSLFTVSYVTFLIHSRQLFPEDRSSMFLRNVGYLPHFYIALEGVGIAQLV